MCNLSVILKYVIITATGRFDDGFRDTNELRAEILDRIGRQLVQLFGVIFRNDERVTVRRRIDVEKRQRRVSLADLLARYRAGNDFAEKTIRIRLNTHIFVSNY